MEKRIEQAWQGWKVVKKIGVGGFGSVYEINRDVFGKTEKAALKVITIPQSNDEIDELYSDGYDEESITLHFKSYLEDIVKEYSLMLDMKGHPNVVYCDDLRYVKHEDGIGWDIFIKMELLTALTRILGNEISEAEIIRLGTDICNALVSCKKENIVHRDIKPQNIFVSRNGDYKLGDFGIAKISEKTQSGTKIGTFEYMPPEVYNGKPYGITADIYSLGLVLYWLLNDRHLPFVEFTGKVPTANEKITARTRRLNGEQLPPPKNGSEELKAVVLKACAFNPADRYSAPDEFLAALKNISVNEVNNITPIAEDLTVDEEKTASIFTDIAPQKCADTVAEEEIVAADLSAAEFAPLVSADVIQSVPEAPMLADEQTTAISTPADEQTVAISAAASVDDDKTISVFDEPAAEAVLVSEPTEVINEAVVTDIEPAVALQEAISEQPAVAEPVVPQSVAETPAPTTEDYCVSIVPAAIKSGIDTVRKVLLSVFDLLTLYMMLWAYPIPRIMAAMELTGSDHLNFFGFDKFNERVVNGIFEFPYDVWDGERVFPIIASIVIMILLVGAAMFRIIARFTDIKNGLTKAVSILFKIAYFMCTVWAFSSYSFYRTVFGGQGDVFWLHVVFVLLAVAFLAFAKRKTFSRYLLFGAVYLIVRAYIAPILIELAPNEFVPVFGFSRYGNPEIFFEYRSEMIIWAVVASIVLVILIVFTKVKVIPAVLSKNIIFGFSAVATIASIVTASNRFGNYDRGFLIYFMHILWLIILLVAAIRFFVGIALKSNKKTL